MGKLQEGIDAFKQGRIEEARLLLIEAARENPRDANVWGWLYRTAVSDQERITFLKKLLEYNPGHQQAQAMLDKLTKPIVAPFPKAQQISISPQQKTKSNSSLILVLIAGISAILLICCLIIAFSSSPSKHSVKYAVNGSASSAFITYDNEQGGTEQVQVALPFEKSYSNVQNMILSIVAQNGGNGTITCEIWIDGKKTKSSTSTAQYGVVTCTDFMP